MIKRIIGVGLAGLAVLAAIVLVRALTVASKQLEVAPVEAVVLPEEEITKRLSEAIQIPTVTVSDGPLPVEELERFHRYLEERFPEVHARLERERVAGHSLLYRWVGRAPSAPPAVLMAHQDVVPVEPGTRDDWEHEPFSGAVVNGWIWGRGALDDKNNLMAILEAVELSLRRDATPARTIYLAFGHDEEIGGKGALAMASLLEDRGVRPGFVLDEGLAIVHGLVPGVSRPVAMIGIAEKGYVTLRLSAQGSGGHSSMPPEETAVGIVARAVAELQAHPFPAGVRGPARQFLDFIGPEASFGFKLAFANLWLFEPALASVFSGSPSTAALVRTTTAPTMFQGGPKDNVLPQRATAAVNFRILPGDSIQTVKERVAAVIDDPRVKISVDAFGSEPSPVSPVDGAGFRLLQETIQEVFPEVVVAPSLVLGATDSRHFARISEAVYRFSPFSYTPEVGEQVHGTGERISVHDYLGTVRFYARLLEKL